MNQDCGKHWRLQCLLPLVAHLQPVSNGLVARPHTIEHVNKFVNKFDSSCSNATHDISILVFAEDINGRAQCTSQDSGVLWIIVRNGGPNGNREWTYEE